MTRTIRSAACAAILAATLGASPALDEPLTLDKLYSLPRIIGTAPAAPTWSPDSSQVAFLWNDEGTNFRDIWVTGDAGQPTRLTAFPRPQVAPTAESTEAILAAQRAALDGGVSAVVWYPHSAALLAVFRGEFYRVVPGADPVALGLRGRQPQFSPDGTAMTFLAQGDLWIVDLREGQFATPRQLTEVAAPGAGIARVAWAPDSAQLAFIARDSSGVQRLGIPDYLGEATTLSQAQRAFPGGEPGRQTLHVVDRADGTPRTMNTGDDDRDLLFTVRWSADSRRLLVDTSDLYVEDRRLLSIDAASGQAEVLYREQEPDNVMAFWSADWAPDGGIYFTSDRDDFYHLYHLAPGADTPRAMTAGDWAVESFHVAAGGLFAVTNAAHRSERHVYALTDDPAAPRRLTVPAGTHAPTYSPDGQRVAVLFSSDAAPPDLYLVDVGDGAWRRVTESPLAEFSQHAWVVPEYVTFESHVDGVTLHGRLMLPPDFDPARRYPAIIGSIYSNTLRNQWGGRNAHPVWGLDQYLLRQGYVLLTLDIRGSWGHGRAFRRQLRRDYGGIDTDDIYSGVQFLGSLGYVDLDRIGLWGSSYGGLMTAMSLFKRPGVFAAGVAGAPATNVWHAMTGEMRVMGRPQDEPEAYADASAFTHAAGLEDPLMIIHGMRDRVVLFKDSLVLLETLMLHEKAHLVEFVPLPNSPHGWDTRELYQTRYAFKKLVAHFERYLTPGKPETNEP
jgi:dipeptidyl-peptidase-4